MRARMAAAGSRSGASSGTCQHRVDQRAGVARGDRPPAEQRLVEQRAVDPVIEIGGCHARADRALCLAAPDQGDTKLAAGGEVTLGEQGRRARRGDRSAEHTSELQSLMRTSYAALCLK